MAETESFVDVTLKVPLTQTAQPVFSKITVNVPESLANETIVISEDLEGNPVEIQSALESELAKYILESDKLSTTIDSVKTATSGLLPEKLGVTDFVSIGVTHAVLAQEYLDSKTEGAEVTYLAVWDNVTKVDAPIVKKASEPTTDSDFPSTEIPPEPEPEPDIDPELTE